jgi:hypothetical protein
MRLPDWPRTDGSFWACFACQGRLAMSARRSLLRPAFGGHGSAGQAAHRPAHRRPEIPSLPERGQARHPFEVTQ